MQHEASPSQWSGTGLIERVPAAWRSALGVLLAGALTVILIAGREWGEMLHQWWNIDTYTHILLVPVIIGWLIGLKRDELVELAPHAWGGGLVLVAAGLTLWLIGRVTDINIIAHAGAVGALQGVAVTALGPRVSLCLALPLCFGVFLVPVGDEFIAPLQSITADIAVVLTHWSGIPTTVDGIYIDTPVGLFIVAEACSGVKFLVAMVTLAVLVCFTRFESWSRRAVFMAASIIIPIIANGIRAWGTIFIAQSQGVEFAAGFDHIFYGWIFFAIVVAIVLAAAWHFFEREPEEYGWNGAQIDQFAWLSVLDFGRVSAIVAIAAIIAIGLCASFAASIVAPVSLG